MSRSSVVKVLRDWAGPLRRIALPTLLMALSLQHFLQVEAQDSFNASLIVRPLFALILLLYVIVVIQEIKASGRGRRAKELPKPFSWKATMLALAVAAYVGLLTVLGFLLATALFLMATTIMLGSRRPGSVLAVPLAVTATTYLMFGQLLNVRLPPGMLFD